MSTLGKYPSQHSAKVQNQAKVSARTKRLSAERRWRDSLDCDTTKSQSSQTDVLAQFRGGLIDLFRIPHWGAT